MRRIAAAVLSLVLLIPASLLAQTVSDPHFHAWGFDQHGRFDREFSREVATVAEHSFRSLTKEWLGYTPHWYKTVAIRAYMTRQPGGQSNIDYYSPANRDGTNVVVRGTKFEILNNVIPHEVTHLWLANHFKFPLPRPIDEGLSVAVEPIFPRQTRMNGAWARFKANRAISLASLLQMTSYPSDRLLVYDQGYAFVAFLLQHKSKRELIRFLEKKYNGRMSWDQAIKSELPYDSLRDLESYMAKWIVDGSPQRMPGSSQWTSLYCGSCGPVGRESFAPWNPPPGIRIQPPVQSIQAQEEVLVPVSNPPRIIPQVRPLSSAGQSCSVDPDEIRRIVDEYITDNLDRLRGPEGPPGLQGEQGPAGVPGADGRDGKGFTADEAYAILERIITENEDRLKGPKGEKGDKGDPGEPGAKGDPADPVVDVPSGMHHLVLVARGTSSYWGTLSAVADKAKERFAPIRVVTSPPPGVGTLPQLIEYRDGVPVGRWVGERQVTLQLQRIITGDWSTL